MRRNIFLLPILLFLKFACVVIVPSLTSFWTERGLSLVGIATVQAMYCITAACIELLSSRSSDGRSRKILLIIGSAALAMSSCTYLVAHTLPLFVLAEVLCGIGFACISGVDEALYYETLVMTDNKQQFQRWWERLQSLALGGCVCWFVANGPLISLFGSTAPFVFSASCYFICIVVACFLRDPQSGDTVKRDAPSVREAFQFVRAAPHELTTLITTSGAFSAILLLPIWWFQPTLHTAGIDQHGVGYFFGIVKFGTALTPLLWGLFVRRPHPLLLYGCFSLLVALSFLAVGTLSWSYHWLFLCIPQLFIGGHYVVYAARYQSLLPNKFRATITSFREVIARTVEALLIIPLYFYAFHTDLSAGFTLLGYMAVGFSGYLFTRFFASENCTQK